MSTTQWFLTSRERGNPSTRLDTRHRGDMAWTEGNLVRPLIHGATYLAELHHRVSQMRDGDLLMFVHWRGDPDERLAGTSDTEIGKVFADAARRGRGQPYSRGCSPDSSGFTPLDHHGTDIREQDW
jgi:hypothetical protein